MFQWWGKAWFYLWFTNLLVNQSAPLAFECIPWGLMDLNMTSLLKYSLNWSSCNSMSSLFQIFSLASASVESFWRLVLLLKTEVMKTFSISPFSMSSVSKVPAPFTHKTTFALIFLLPLIYLHADIAALQAGMQAIPPRLCDPNKIIAPELPTDI